MRIYGVRSDLIGDMVISLPILNLLEEKYPGSFKYFSVLNKCKQAAPLFINHPLIDKITVSQVYDGFSAFDERIKYDCDLRLDTRPQHENPYWYNEKGMMVETFNMVGFDYDPKYGKPKLEKWWDEGDDGKFPIEGYHIAFWPVAGYGAGHNRSPSYRWWQNLILEMTDAANSKYIFHHFGHYNEELLWDLNLPFYQNHTNLSFFEQIKLATKCQINLGTDSGSSHVMNAFGGKCVTLLTNWQPNHKEDRPFALAPENYNNNNTNLFAANSCDLIDISKIIELIK